MIEFRYRPSFEDYWLFNRWNLLRSFKLIIPFAVLSLLAFLFAPLVLRSPPANKTVFEVYQQAWVLLILPGIVVLTFALTRQAAKKSWKATGSLREEREYLFDEDGLQVVGGSYSGRAEWKNFIHAESYKGIILLQVSLRQFHYFNAASLPSQEEFFELVSRKLPAARILKK